MNAETLVALITYGGGGGAAADALHRTYGDVGREGTAMSYDAMRVGFGAHGYQCVSRHRERLIIAVTVRGGDWRDAADAAGAVPLAALRGGGGEPL